MKSMVWAVFQYGVEGWTLKKSDRNRIEAFEVWCWRKNNNILVILLGGNAGQLALTVLEGIMEGSRHQDRPRRQWIHDIEE